MLNQTPFATEGRYRESLIARLGNMQAQNSQVVENILSPFYAEYDGNLQALRDKSLFPADTLYWLNISLQIYEGLMANAQKLVNAEKNKYLKR